MKQMDPLGNAKMLVQEQYSRQPNPNANNQQQSIKKESIVNDNNNYAQPQVNEPSAVDPSGGAVPEIGQTMPFAEAKKLDVPNKEAYIHDDEFQQIFGMTKDEFYKQRPWKQKTHKRNVGIF
eukprot:TRINITY_DN1490_c0_g1_i1.p2 TRINITY_DN1490_c0_g1~~TRINITY_DN1490_c0_g1_i1.p2  ORF type:complete len:122 (-),score=33.74 TRINITY_DN1490_c0_g1_i1:221-586(-)